MPRCTECGKYIKPEATAEHKVKHLKEELSAIYHERTDSMHRFDAIKDICIYCGHSKAYVKNYHPVCQSAPKKKKKTVKKKARKKTVKPLIHVVPDYLDFDREV